MHQQLCMHAALAAIKEEGKETGRGCFILPLLAANLKKEITAKLHIRVLYYNDN